MSDKADQGDQDLEDVLLVYIGIAVGKSNIKYQLWLHVTEEEYKTGYSLTDEEIDVHGGGSRVRVYKKLAKAVGRPGVVYRFKQRKGGSTITDAGVYVGIWKDENRRLQWQAEYDTFRDMTELEAQAKKGGRRNELYEILVPVQLAYNRLPSTQRSMYLARIVEFVTRGTKR